MNIFEFMNLGAGQDLNALSMNMYGKNLALKKDVYVTPEMAKEWLEHNENNRKLRNQAKNTYISQMTRGEWGECDSPIAFDSDGVLVNGQHRLEAVVESGVPQIFNVWFGYQHYKFIDTGARRTTADALKLSGEENAHFYSNNACAIANFCIKQNSRGNAKINIGAERLQKYMYKYYEQFDFVSKMHSGAKKGISSSFYAALFSACVAGVDKNAIRAFEEIVKDGSCSGEYAVTVPQMSIAIKTSKALDYLANQNAHSTKNKEDIFIRSECGLYYFINNRDVKKFNLKKIWEVPEE